jgi:alcohol dehydrogenase class IV
MLCGLFLPYVTAYNAAAEPERHANIARALGAEARPEAAGQAIYDLEQALGVPNVSAYGITAQTIPQIAKGSQAHPETASNPRPIGEREYVKILEQTLAWERPA